MQCWHLTHSAEGRYPILPDEKARRSAVRKLALACGAELILFCIVDDHIHNVVLAKRERAGRLAQAIARSLRSVAVSPIGPARIRPVEGRSHMEKLVTYLLVQPKRHDIPTHPALWSGSCFQDIAGARFIEGMRLQIGNVLPRFRIRTAFEAVGLPPKEITPADDSAIRAAGATRLVSDAGAALAIGPPLAGKTALLVCARRAVTQIARKVGIPFSEVAWALGITERAARRLLAPHLEKEKLHAIRKYLALEDIVSGSSSG